MLKQRKKEEVSVNVEKLSVIEIASAEKLWIKEVQSTIVQNSSFRKTKIHLGIAEMEGILTIRKFTFKRRIQIPHLSFKRAQIYRTGCGRLPQ